MLERLLKIINKITPKNQSNSALGAQHFMVLFITIQTFIQPPKIEYLKYFFLDIFANFPEHLALPGHFALSFRNYVF